MTLVKFQNTQDPEAFRDLLKTHSGLVYGVAMRITRNHALAEEVSQAVFIKLSKKATTIREPNALPGWLQQTAVNESRILLRKESRYRNKINNLKESSVINQETQMTPLVDTHDFLDEAIGQLSPDDRKILLLHYYEKLTFRKIAETVGSTEAACQKKTRRVIEKLKVKLNRKGVTITTAVIALNLSQELCQAAPVHLVSSISESVQSASASTKGSTRFSLSPNHKILGFAAGFVCVLTWAIFNGWFDGGSSTKRSGDSEVGPKSSELMTSERTASRTRVREANQDPYAEAMKTAMAKNFKAYNGWAEEKRTLFKEILADDSRLEWGQFTFRFFDGDTLEPLDHVTLSDFRFHLFSNELQESKYSRYLPWDLSSVMKSVEGRRELDSSGETSFRSVINSGIRTVNVRSDGYLETRVDYAPHQAALVRVPLFRAKHELVAKVVDERTAKPVKSADVTLMVSNIIGGDFRVSGTTDVNGRVRFDQVPAFKKAYIRAETAGYFPGAVKDGSYHSSGIRIGNVVDRDPSLPVEIMLRPIKMVSGKVFGSDGQPVVGQYVYIIPQWIDPLDAGKVAHEVFGRYLKTESTPKVEGGSIKRCKTDSEGYFTSTLEDHGKGVPGNHVLTCQLYGDDYRIVYGDPHVDVQSMSFQDDDQLSLTLQQK